MQLLLAFLFGTFVLGGLAGPSRRFQKPSVLLAACVIIGVMFYSRRFL
jgi:biotin transporter BioY